MFLCDEAERKIGSALEKHMKLALPYKIRVVAAMVNKVVEDESNISFTSPLNHLAFLLWFLQTHFSCLWNNRDMNQGWILEGKEDEEMYEERVERGGQQGRGP